MATLIGWPHRPACCRMVAIQPKVFPSPNGATSMVMVFSDMMNLWTVGENLFSKLNSAILKAVAE